MPGAIMLASIFFVTIIEMVFSPNQHVCGGNEGVNAVVRNSVTSHTSEDPQKENEETETAPASEGMQRTYSDGSMRVRDMGALRGRVTSISRTLSRYRAEGQRLDTIESAGTEYPNQHTKAESEEGVIEEDPERNLHTFQPTPEQARQKAVMQCFLLEMGILFHSIFIGMALAVAVGNDFVVLLIAIIFHREWPHPIAFVVIAY